MKAKAQKQQPRGTAGKRRPVDADFEPLLDLIANDTSLNSACQQLGLDTPSTYHWIHDDEGRSQKYGRACECRGELHAEKINTVAGLVLTGKVKPDAGRVAIDAYKWNSARMAPKKAPIQRHEHTFSDLTDDEIDARISAMLSTEDDDEGGGGYDA